MYFGCGFNSVTLWVTYTITWVHHDFTGSTYHMKISPISGGCPSSVTECMGWIESAYRHNGVDSNSSDFSSLNISQLFENIIIYCLFWRNWDLCFIWYYSPRERNYVTYIGNVMAVGDLALRINVIEVSRFNNEKIKRVRVGLYLPGNIAWRQIFLWSFQSIILPATSEILRFSYIQKQIPCI